MTTPKMFVELDKGDKQDIKDGDACVSLAELMVTHISYLQSFQIGDIVRINELDCDYDDTNKFEITPKTITISKGKTDIEIPSLFQVVDLDRHGAPWVKEIPHPQQRGRDVNWMGVESAWSLIDDSFYNFDELTPKQAVNFIQTIISMDSSFADSMILGSEYIPYEEVDIDSAIDEEDKKRVLDYFERKDYNKSIKRRFSNLADVITWLKSLQVGDVIISAYGNWMEVRKVYCSRYGVNYGITVHNNWGVRSILAPTDFINKTYYTNDKKELPTRPAKELIARFAPHRLPKTRGPAKVKKVVKDTSVKLLKKVVKKKK